MTEGGMAEVVAEGYSLGEVFVQVQRAGYGASDLHHLQGVGQAGAIVVAIGGDEDLCFVHEAAEGFSVDDAVPVALEVVPDAVEGLGPPPPGATLAGPVGGARTRLVVAG